MWRSCSELVYYCKTGWQDCFDSVVTFKTCHSPSGLLVKTQFFTTEAKGWVQEWHPYLNNVLVLDQSNWPVFAALHLFGVFLGKNSSLGARKDWRIVFFFVSVHLVCQRFLTATRVCWENSVGLKWHSCDTSFENKAPMWWVFMWKKQQSR